MKTALVFSAGGMFGAWQAGVWRELEGNLRPDIVVGASIGAINGWLVAGGCPAVELERRWLDLRVMARHRWQVPRRPLEGIIDSGPLEALIREMHEAWPPRVEFGVVVEDTVGLRVRLVRTPDVTWQHLAATIGLMGIFRQYRIDGRVYSDGGVLGALPSWAAAEMGAERIVGVNCIPKLPSALMTAGVRALRFVAHKPPRVPDSVEVHEIRPDGCLGRMRESMVWTEANTRRWIEQGRADARAWLERRSLET